MMVLPQFRVANILGALMTYKSLRAKGSWAFFLPPFFPLEIRLFLPTAILNDFFDLRETRENAQERNHIRLMKEKYVHG